MSWKTDSSGELLPQFKAAAVFFGIGEPLSAERVGGQANKNYRVRTVAGSFIFKVIIEHPIEDVATEAIYLDRLEKHGFPAAQYLKAANGDFYYLDGDDTLIVVLDELPGEAPRRDENTCFVIGQTMARLHSIDCAGLPPRNNWLRPGYLPETLAALGDGYAAERMRLAEALRSIESFPRGDLPLSIVHGDMSPRNCLFRGEELVAFLDWEEAGVGPAVLDFAICALFFCGEKNEFNVPNYRAFEKGYQQVRCLTKLEQEFLPMAIKVAGLTISAWGLMQFGVRNPDAEMVKSWDYYWETAVGQSRLSSLS